MKISNKSFTSPDKVLYLSIIEH